VEHIINSTQPGWKNIAKGLARNLHATVGFDAVGGQSTSDIVEILAEPGFIYIYGALSGEKTVIDPTFLLGEKKRICGLSLVTWLLEMSYLKRVSLLQKAEGLLENVLKCEVCDIIPLNQVKNAFVNYSSHKTNSKYLIRMRQ